MSWQRRPVAQAIAGLVTGATEGAVFVHEATPETVNPPAVVIMRPASVSYSAAAFGIDDVELPVAIIGGLESDDAVDDLKSVVRSAVMGDPTLGGAVLRAWPSGERNWRNLTGAGGIQLLVVDLVIQITM